MMTSGINSWEQPAMVYGVDGTRTSGYDQSSYRPLVNSAYKISGGYLTPSAPCESPFGSPLFDPRSDQPFDKIAYTPLFTTASTTQRVISSGSDTTIEPNPLDSILF